MVYDYVIVGGGSAGCVAAGRLAREEGARVMLLEGGGMDDSLLVRAPAGLVKLMKPGSRYYQEYVSAPQPQLGGRTVPILQPWVLGGGSTVNAMT
ncbi:FAD-binding protein, partial [Pseudomonas aeruginosa]|uniref:FAD-binding protein n=1 Tax=Pseudomonas aeruginosa TaxID=287 RepID=UPI001C4A0C9A